MGKLVLVVEDDPCILEIVDFILNDSGFRTILSETGEELLTLVNEATPDLVLMDIRLPPYDGRDLCRLIKAHKQEIPVVLMSAHCDGDDVMEEGCADDFIPKPFDISDLIATVKKQCEPQA